MGSGGVPGARGMVVGEKMIGRFEDGPAIDLRCGLMLTPPVGGGRVAVERRCPYGSKQVTFACYAVEFAFRELWPCQFVFCELQ